MTSKNLKYFVLGASVVAFGLWGLALTIPNSFNSGDVISAAKLNDNFAAVKTAVDALEAPGSVSTAKIADGAVTAAKTADEPGFNTISAFSGTAAALSTTATGITNITLAAPAAGFAVVTANFNWIANHNTGLPSEVDFSLSKTPGSMGTLASLQRVRIPANIPTGANFQQSVALSEVFTVAAGNNTFHLNAQIVGGTASQFIGQAKLTVIYLPTRYGTGATVN